jgi:hypothetical protein
MTIRFVGVAIGGRKAPAAATAVLIRTGRGEIPMLVAAANPMGMTIRAVAVSLINRPMMAVSTKGPARVSIKTLEEPGESPDLRLFPELPASGGYHLLAERGSLGMQRSADCS